jgi:hypothetical protein
LAFSFPIFWQVRHGFKPRIIFQHIAKTDVIRLIRIGMVDLTAQELPVSIFMRDQQDWTFPPQDMATAVHPEQSITVFL